MSMQQNTDEASVVIDMMDYRDVSQTYPTLQFLQRLTFTMKHELFKEPFEPHPSLAGCSANLEAMKPFLDRWYHPKDYWYAKDIVSALEQLVNAKVYVNRKLSQTDEGLMFLGSEELRRAEDRVEREIKVSLLGSADDRLEREIRASLL